MFTLQLPIPDRRLSPNARSHWWAKSVLTKAGRTAARIEALRVLDGRLPPKWIKARMRVTLFHRTKRTPDPDNFIASLKAYCDGIADAGIVVNDRGLWPERPVFVQVDRLPRIEIEIESEL